MMNYSVGVETREKIITECRKLFYEHGYEKTSFGMICDNININRGLITYHFKSKSKLAQIIYNEVWNDIDRIIDQQFGSYSIIYKTFIENILLFRCLNDNNNFLRFYVEVRSNTKLTDYTLERQKIFIRKSLKIINGMLSDEELVTLSCMFLGVENGLVTNMYNKKITEQADQISKKDLHFVLSMLGFPPDTIDQYYREVLKMLNDYRLCVKENFNIVLEKKGEICVV